MSAFVEIAGERYELAEPATYTYDEARLAKALSNGMSLAEIEGKLSESDPDAWTAVAFISMRRVRPKTTQQETIAALRRQPLLAVVDSLERDEEEAEEDDARPPVSKATRPSGTRGANDENDEPSDLPFPGPETTPETPGDPT